MSRSEFSVTAAVGRAQVGLGALFGAGALIGVAYQVVQPQWVEPPTGFYALLAAGLALSAALAVLAVFALKLDRLEVDAFVLLGAGWAFALSGLGRFGIYDWYRWLVADQEYGYPLWIPWLGIAATAMLGLGTLAMLAGLLLRLRRRRHAAAQDAGPAVASGGVVALSRGAVIAGCLLLVAAAVGFALALEDWYPQLSFAEFSPGGLYLIVGAGCLVAILVAAAAAGAIRSGRVWLDLAVLAGVGWAFGLAGPERTEIYEWYISAIGDQPLPYGSWIGAVYLAAIAIAFMGSAALAAIVALRAGRDPYPASQSAPSNSPSLGPQTRSRPATVRESGS